MSKVVYEGARAGLGALNNVKGAGGNTASAFDYTVYCSCETNGKSTNLGPMGRFVPNAQGFRTILCNVCKHVTIINEHAQVTNRVPFANLPTH